MFHGQLSQIAKSPTQFRLLNNSCTMTVGLSPNEEYSEELNAFLAILKSIPTGESTPICSHIAAITDEITPLSNDLVAEGKKVAIIIATDGEATDGNLKEVMQPLLNLPCYIIVRLCTNQEDVVKYWNDLKKEIEVPMEIIDDVIGEVRT